MERIYLIHAKAQSGKDTCAEYMKEVYEAKGKRVLIIAFADYVKFVLDKYYHTPACRTPEYRTRIQSFATDQVRKSVPNYWAEVVAQLLYAIRDDFDIVIIPDWRFKNELSALEFYLMDEVHMGQIAIVKMFLYRIKNQETDHMTDDQRQHQSETELDNFVNFDYNILNKTGCLDETKEHLKSIIEVEEFL